MESANIQELYDDWQSAVQAHVILFREGRMRGLTSEEIEEIGHVYLLRIDAVYARLKQAEAQQAEAVASMQIWKAPAAEDSSAGGVLTRFEEVA